MVPCVWWSVPQVRFILEISDEPGNLWSCHHPSPQGSGVVGEAHSTSVSFDGSIVLLVGLVDWNAGELPARLLDCETAGVKFPGYFWMGCGQCDHVSQMNRNPARILVGVVHRTEPRRQLSQGVQVHLEGSLAQGVICES